MDFKLIPYMGICSQEWTCLYLCVIGPDFGRLEIGFVHKRRVELQQV